MTLDKSGLKKAFNITAKAGAVVFLSVAIGAIGLTAHKLHRANSLDPIGRPLTAGEVAMAQTVFGNTADFSHVRLHNAPLARELSLTWGSDIYLETRPMRAKDLSGPDVGISVKGTLIHELTHVRQQQQTMRETLTQIWRTLPGRLGYLLFHNDSAYKYGATSTKKFADKNEEQQAQMAAGWFTAQETLRSDTCTLARGGDPQNMVCRHARQQMDALTLRIRPSLPLPGWK